ncbi:sarcoplasmic calcium-binding protein 1-like [Uloborus diversus]|uniref:sarcoplasmic calcium-binding protein 1-like n=1 Tax=Uloborus diversus TaxID=327109 RepID=UPI0024098B02|nr:sarcoplasmic calcium-binding protein 1-like [Uloborus diversus]
MGLFRIDVGWRGRERKDENSATGGIRDCLPAKYTKIQRRGKLDQDVYKRWESILGKWWDELTQHADFNKDRVVEFDEWLKFFHNMGQQTKTHKELPDFLQNYLQLFFFIMDTNKDGLFCIKDYKKYLGSHDMDVTRAKECFETMLIDEDRANGNAMTSDRFRELVYDFWVSQNDDSPGKYICGTFDSALLQELESMNKTRS